LIRRGNPPLLGEWSLPGGVLDGGETLREAVMREAHEETGLTVEPGEMLACMNASSGRGSGGYGITLS